MIIKQSQTVNFQNKCYGLEIAHKVSHRIYNLKIGITIESDWNEVMLNLEEVQK